MVVGLQFGSFLVSPVIELNPMEPQICKIYLAFTNSFVISIFATGLCVLVAQWLLLPWHASSTLRVLAIS